MSRVMFVALRSAKKLQEGKENDKGNENSERKRRSRESKSGYSFNFSRKKPRGNALADSD